MHENVKVQDQGVSYWSSIKTMLLYLGYVENNWEPDVELDLSLAQRLREL